MNTDALARLGRNAKAFGKAYVALKAALVREGVTDVEARNEARNAATLAVLAQDEDGEACPLCGRAS